LEERAIQVLIIDDHKLFAEAIRSTLQRQGMEILDPVTRGSEGIDVATQKQPDVALVDLGLPDMRGIEVGRKILEVSPETKVVAVTALNDPDMVTKAIRAGFHGYLTKDTPLSLFVDSLRSALQGQLVVPHRLAAPSNDMTDDEREALLLTKQLTARELEVLTLLAQGASSSQIAKRLSVSPNTVRSHVQNILTKLQVHSRLEAAAFAVRYRVVKTPNGSSEDLGSPDQ
jgi:two-component system nitrate/nitrite response regulator NarL